MIDRGACFCDQPQRTNDRYRFASGERVWEQDIGSTHGPWVAGDYVYVVSNDDELICLARNDGQGAMGAPAAAL